jgi:hypothetical protein
MNKNAETAIFILYYVKMPFRQFFSFFYEKMNKKTMGDQEQWKDQDERKKQ